MNEYLNNKGEEFMQIEKNDRFVFIHKCTQTLQFILNQSTIEDKKLKWDLPFVARR